MVKILQYYPILQDAGTEMVIMNWWKNVDHKKVQFDFLCRKEGTTSKHFAGLGSQVYYVDGADNAEYFAALKAFFTSHPEYQILHVHNSAEQDLVLKVAKKCGVKHRIIHSHVARPDLPWFTQWAKAIKDIPLEMHANHFLACSSWAIDWLFPHCKSKAKVMHNAIELSRFVYNKEARQQYRNELGIDDDEIMVLDVARFSDQKNHVFAIPVAEEVVGKNAKIKFVFVGEGPLWNEMNERIKSKGLQEQIILTGPRRDVNQLTSAADIFMCPSKYEGLGIVYVEAQAAGLPTLSSDRVPPEADMGTGLFSTFPLKHEIWVNAVLNAKPCEDRPKKCNEASESDYNIQRIARKMEDYYSNLD